jgi:hypothetical protein
MCRRLSDWGYVCACFEAEWVEMYPKLNVIEAE